MLKSGCVLDCYDSCELSVDESYNFQASKDKPTSRFLCQNLAHYHDFETIKKPRFDGVEITKEESLEKLFEIIKESNSTLYYKNGGNFGLMQDVLGHFFASHNDTLTKGSLCDGAGDAGIVAGRGVNHILPISQIEKSEVVIVWGRDIHTSSSHLLPILKGKKLIVIDPIKTKIAKMADLHVQLKPRSDIYVAILLYRFAMIEGEYDEEYLEEHAGEFEEFYELSQTIRIKKTLDKIDVDLGVFGKILGMMKDKKTSIIVGVGVQKYREGADVLRAIDAFALVMGLFGKEGCGVSYLGNSKESIESPFKDSSKKVSKVDTKFDQFDTVFVQGANPLNQMPNTLRVKESYSKVKNTIYFGLYENETSQNSRLILPAQEFYFKNDVRSSYGDNKMTFMNALKKSENGFSEYELSNALCKEFDVELKTEDEYLEHFKSFSDENGNIKGRQDLPYKDGFDDEFEFLDELELKLNFKKDLFLITAKSPSSLNSMFKREKCVYLHPSHNFKDTEMIRVSSDIGFVDLEVKNNEDIREDCVLIRSGVSGVNNLTPSHHSYDGLGACYQDVKVKIGKI